MQHLRFGKEREPSSPPRQDSAHPAQSDDEKLDALPPTAGLGLSHEAKRRAAVYAPQRAPTRSGIGSFLTFAKSWRIHPGYRFKATGAVFCCLG